MPVSINNAKKYVHLYLNTGKSMHYRITFYQELIEGLILCFDFWHGEHVLQYFIQLGE